jgi:hypothetical protein
VYNAYFVLMGSLCLGVALIQAWLLVARFASDDSAIARLIPGKQDLLRSHIDYLMMAQFLFVFFALYKHFALLPPLWIVAAVCIGSFFNPFAFFVRAIKPGYLKAPPAHFMAMITVSCILTTVGYGATAWLLANAALAE